MSTISSKSSASATRVGGVEHHRELGAPQLDVLAQHQRPHPRRRRPVDQPRVVARHVLAQRHEPAQRIGGRAPDDCLVLDGVHRPVRSGQGVQPRVHQHGADLVRLATPDGQAEARRPARSPAVRPANTPRRRVGIEPITSVRSSRPIAGSGTRTSAPSQRVDDHRRRRAPAIGVGGAVDRADRIAAGDARGRDLAHHAAPVTHASSTAPRRGRPAWRRRARAAPRSATTCRRRHRRALRCAAARPDLVSIGQPSRVRGTGTSSSSGGDDVDGLCAAQLGLGCETRRGGRTRRSPRPARRRV